MIDEGTTDLDSLHDDDAVETNETANETTGTTEGTPEATATEETTTEPSATTESTETAEATTETPETLEGVEGLDRNNMNEVDDSTPGIEQFLSKYGVVGGMISFEDGESKHFNDLTESEKFNILQDLSETTSQDLEAQYGLDEEEVGLINWLREQNRPLQESIEELAQARVEQILAFNESGSTDFSAMADDAIMMRWLKETDPEASEEDLAEELTRQKESKLYEKNINRLREQFTAQQAEVEKQAQAEQEQEMFNALEEQRTVIVDAVQDINEVAGFEVSDEDKNVILKDLLETNEYGDSLFMEEVFSDPKTLFKAAWMYKNGEAYIDNLEQYYKKAIAKAYQDGKSQAINGMPSRPVSGSVEPTQPQTKDSEPIRKENFVNLDDLHSDF